MNIYKTSDAAELIGIHPNTVRLYEKWGLLPKVCRKPNGYRIFTDFHIEQLRLIRTAFKIEIVQNGLRKKVTYVLKATANRDFDKALMLAHDYLDMIHREQKNAEEAIKISEEILNGKTMRETLSMSRREAAKYLNISTDTLRNWELNGLLKVKRRQNRYRYYTNEDINLLKIIRSLRCANYSLESILRLLNALSVNQSVNIKKVLNTPHSLSLIHI